MKSKILFTLAASTMLIFGGCSNKPVENAPAPNKEDEVAKASSELKYLKSENDKVVDIGKPVQYVQVKEVNSNSLKERPIGGISVQKSLLYKNDNLLYLFFDAENPTPKTEMIVTYEKFDKDYLLDYDLTNTTSSKVELDTKVAGEYLGENDKLIINKNRLIKNVSLKKVGDKVEVEVNGKTKLVNMGKSKEIKFTNGKVNSTLIVSNYNIPKGKIVYQKPTEDMEKGLEQIKENKS